MQYQLKYCSRANELYLGEDSRLPVSHIQSNPHAGPRSCVQPVEATIRFSSWSREAGARRVHRPGTAAGLGLSRGHTASRAKAAMHTYGAWGPACWRQSIRFISAQRQLRHWVQARDVDSGSTDEAPAKYRLSRKRKSSRQVQGRCVPAISRLA